MINYVENKKYYEVECKCGHTGSRKFYIPIKFPIIACDAKEAAFKGRMTSRCKHHHKDCVLNVKEITYAEYIELIRNNKKDPFLNCHSIQEQRAFDLSDRFILEPRYKEMDNHNEEEIQVHQLYKGKNKIKNPKKYFRLNQDYYTEVSY